MRAALAAFKPGVTEIEIATLVRAFHKANGATKLGQAMSCSSILVDAVRAIPVTWSGRDHDPIQPPPHE
ncbi:MAG: hypothetical protein ACYC0C_15010 [Devosia sp.]